MIKKIITEVLGTNEKPEARGSEEIIWIHFIVKGCLVTLNFFEVINDLHITFNIVLFFLNQHFLLDFGFFVFKFLVFGSFKIFNFVWIFLPPSLARRATRLANRLNFLNFFFKLLTMIFVWRLNLARVLINLIRMLRVLVHQLIHKLNKWKIIRHKRISF